MLVIGLNGQLNLKIFKKKKNKCSSESRTFVKVDPKYRNDIIWILWDVIFFTSKKHNTFIQQIIDHLFSLFCIKYTTASCKKRRYLLYFAISVITEEVRQIQNWLKIKK